MVTTNGGKYKTRPVKGRGWAVQGRKRGASCMWPPFKVLLIVGMAGMLGVTTSCFADPSGGKKPWVKEADRLSDSRLKPWQEGRTPGGAPEDLSSPIYEGMRADNFMGVDIATGVANVGLDTLKEVGNFPQCMDYKLVPGCWCCIPGTGFVIMPAYEYRWPVARYEVVRQPFQSDYWPKELMQGFQKMNPNVEAGMFLAGFQLLRFMEGMGKHGFTLQPPSGEQLEVMRKAMRLALEEIPNPGDNKGRGGGTVPLGRTSSVHLASSPLAQLANFSLLNFFWVKSHIRDHERLGPLPSWSEDPLHFLWARSPAMSHFFAQRWDDAYKKIAAQLLDDPTGGVLAKQKDWEKTFQPSLQHTTGMAPRATPVPTSGAGSSGDVDSDPDVAFPSALDALARATQKKGSLFPHLRFGNDRWFPFEQRANGASEPQVAAGSAIKQGKLDCNMLGYPDVQDLDDDRFHYLRGDELESSHYSCVYPELTSEEFGKANVLERPAKPIMIAHWKRYTGCPIWLEPCYRCPYTKIARQRKCNARVKNRPRETTFEAPPEWPWE